MYLILLLDFKIIDSNWIFLKIIDIFSGYIRLERPHSAVAHTAGSLAERRRIALQLFSFYLFWRSCKLYFWDGCWWETSVSDLPRKSTTTRLRRVIFIFREHYICTCKQRSIKLKYFIIKWVLFKKFFKEGDSTSSILIRWKKGGL